MDNIFEAKKISWCLANPVLYEHSGGLWITQGMQTIDTLPVEFFSHQFLEVDPFSIDSVLEFACTWGIMTHPSRTPGHFISAKGLENELNKRELRISKENYCSFVHGSSSNEFDFYKSFINAVDLSKSKENDRIAKDATPAYILKDSKAPCADKIGQQVSLIEMQASICDLQHEIKEMLSYIAGLIDTWSGTNINNGSCNPLFVKPEPIHPIAVRSLTNAICNQIIETIADDAPWKLCSCDGCGRYFKRHQRNKPAKTEKTPSDAKYCCSTCAERQKKRNYRKKQKTKPASA